MRLLRSLATTTLLPVVVLGILAIPAGAFIGVDSPFDGAPIPMQELVRRRAVGKAVMFAGGGAAATAASGLYAIGRVRGRDD